MAPNPFSRTKRHALTTSDAASATTETSRKGSSRHRRNSSIGESPLAVIRQLGDKLRPHTAITSTQDPPGANSDDEGAGTAAPIAAHANPRAQNAGAHSAGVEGAPVPDYNAKSSGKPNTKGHSRNASTNTNSSDNLKPPAKDGTTDANAAASVNGGEHVGQISNDNGAQNEKGDNNQNNGVRMEDNPPPDSSLVPSVAQEERLKYVKEALEKGLPGGPKTPKPGHDAIPGITFGDGDSDGKFYGDGAPVSFRQNVLHPLDSAVPAGRAPPYAFPAGGPSAIGGSGSIHGGGGPSKEGVAPIYKGPDDLGDVELAGRYDEDKPKSEAASEAASLNDTNQNSAWRYVTPGNREIVTHFESSKNQHGDRDSEENNMPYLPSQTPGLSTGEENPKLPGEVRSPHDSESKNVSKEFEKKVCGTEEERLAELRKRLADEVGWRQVGGWTPQTNLSREESENLLTRSSLLEDYIDNRLIGDWYQNTFLIVFTAVFSYVAGILGRSISWLIVVLLFSATVYRASVRRMRRNYRDDIIRELSLRKIENDVESMEWLNSFIVKFWLIYEPSLSEMITQIANEVLGESTPPLIKSLKLSKFTLGTKAPRIEFVRSFPKTDPSISVMDWSVSFTPNDTMDLTARQLKNKVNPKVVLKVKVGKGFISKSFPILLEDMSFSGVMRLRIKLIKRYPHIQTVDVSFLEPPKFDFVLKPIGGETFGFDINIIPGLSRFIKEMVNANLGPMVYAPNAFQINVEQLMAGVGILTGIGVLTINVRKAWDLLPDRVDGVVDPYVRIVTKDGKELKRSKVKDSTLEPVWNEYLHCIVSSLSDTLILQVLDANEMRNDRVLGSLSINIEDVMENNGDNITTTKLTLGGKPTGTMQWSVHFSSVQMSPTADSDDTDLNFASDTKSGILGVKLISARNLDPSIGSVGLLSTYAEVEINGKPFATTKAAKNTNDPEFNLVDELIVKNKMTSQLIVRLYDQRKGNRRVAGIARFKLSKLIMENEKGQSWFNLGPGDKGQIQLQTQWKPVSLPDVIGSSYMEPTGVVRLNIISAKNLRNLEHIGKIDPYIRVMLNNKTVARTDYFKNNLNPVYNEFLYVPVQDELQTLKIEAMDVEKRSRDRSLGYYKLNIGSLTSRDEFGELKAFISSSQLTSQLALPDRGPKGSITYSVEFYPTIPIIEPSQVDFVRNERKEIAQLKKKDNLTDKEKEQLSLREERISMVGIDLTREVQMSYNSGVVVFSFSSVTGVKRGRRLRITRDNIPKPIYISPAALSEHFVIGQSSDYVTGQLPLTSIRIQIVDHDNIVDPKKVEGEVTIGAKEALEKAYYAPHTFDISETSKVTLTCRFFPMPDYVIDPSENIRFTGCVEIRLHKAVGLEAADSSGTSDPYCAFYLDDSKNKKLYESQTIKKTLDPVWNEAFRFDVLDIRETTVKALVYDWDMGNRDDYLGGATFDCSELEPLVWKDYEVSLTNVKKKGHLDLSKAAKKRDGTLYLSIRHTPGILQKDDDEDIYGIKSVTKTVGNGIAAPERMMAKHTPYGTIKRLITGHENDGKDDEFDETPPQDWKITISKISGIKDVSNVQLRAFTISDREKEVFKSKNLEVENNVARPQDHDSFEVSARESEQIGFKIREVKDFARHSEIGQSSLAISAGEHRIDFGDDMMVHVEVNHA